MRVVVTSTNDVIVVVSPLKVKAAVTGNDVVKTRVPTAALSTVTVTVVGVQAFTTASVSTDPSGLVTVM